MNAYERFPWRALYDTGIEPNPQQEYTNGLDMFAAALERAPHESALLYFDGRLDWQALDAWSDRIACLLLDEGVQRGDRVALYLQNVPQFVMALLGIWKAGAVMVPVNPMNRARELKLLLDDSQARVLICDAALEGEVVREVIASIEAEGNAAPRVFTTRARALQTRDDPRVFGTQREASGAGEGARDLLQAAQAVQPGRKPPPVVLAASDPAMLVYTSGTSGRPKGAICTHGNFAFNSQTYRDFCGLREGGPILGVAPLFHITGLVGHIGAAWIARAPLILTHRFDPAATLDAIEEHRAEFTIGAITVFIALLHHADATREKLATLTKIYSGGAPIAPSVVEAFRAKFGHVIHGAYGLTETNSPTHMVPLARTAPVDPHSGALAMGVPVPGAEAAIVDDDGNMLAAGETGEIVCRGPMVVPGYWNNAAATADAFRGGWFHTGDVGFMDEAGWFYLVDRKKDMINAAGYKVWPREVEDVLYGHPAVREAAVVGVPDPYRGETVKAVVSLRAGAVADAAELIAFCKARMAAYKYPRIVEFRDELPKTATGKILRRELR
ncbi:long-chain fatty acid--CoA ligase [Paraburkholderia guartelaensis]|uniref:Long-chain fatty acid--CoA ligase n=1 Tax=Paraburkholderia guartelaensis TaxID=2546446 RepID=A0A4R5LCW1_9BURK|nr:AMP-binding protein [Paraburkholderia guartelaensis]TDG06312.1 long-chain fatty acid--CoA ligase [Paraburkholderia guartelaensis]